MSPAEVGHRLREARHKQTTRLWRQGWARYQDNATTIPMLPGLGDQVLNASAELRSAIAESAREIRSGKFQSLGVTWPVGAVDMRFPASVWALDPCTGKAWPGSTHFCFDIGYRLERDIGDVKYVWEFGRLQFLPVLAADAVLHGRAESLAAVQAALDSWYAHNPPFTGVHWAELLNVAIRAINVLVVVTLCGDQLATTTIQRVRTMLAAHAKLLSLFPSLHSSANNHLVAECAAEYLIALAMPELATSAHAKKWARSELIAQVEKQILPDGWPAEQSPSYGAFTAEFVVLASLAAEAAGEPFPEAVAHRLVSFAHHIAVLANSSGLVPSLGDNDEGRVLTLCQHEPDYPLSIASAICSVFSTPLRCKAAPRSALRDALFGRASREAIFETGQFRFPNGGCSVDRRRIAGHACVMTFDHGPLGYLSIAAHGHADALAITLDVEGTPLLVDPGTYLYHSGGTWRDWFRGTRAHNTLCLGGKDQSQMSGPFNWGDRATSRLDSSASANEWPWIASHDGYCARYGVRHERSVAQLNDGYRIVDRLIGATAPAPAAEVVLQLGIGLHPVHTGNEFVVHDARGPLATIRFEQPGELACQQGGTTHDSGWASPRFGVREPAHRITWRGRVPDKGAAFSVRLFPRQPEASIQAS